MRIVAILAAVLAMSPVSPLSAAELAPHEATYTLVLEKYHGPGEIQSWEGTSHYSISRDCQKWKLQIETNIRASVNGTFSESRGVATTYEGLDGNRMEFNFRVTLNDQTLEHRKGSAKLQGPGKPGVATYRIPEGETVDLPAGTIFPVTSWRASIAHLGSGKKKWKQTLFVDGSLANYSFAIRKSGVAATVHPTGDAGLISRPGWWLDTVHLGKDLNLEESFLAHANGVFSLIFRNLPGFTTREELVDIRALPTPQC